MAGYGTPLNLTLPTIDGVFTEAQAAPLINTALAAVIARLESKVGSADLDLNADVSLKSGAIYSGLKDAQRVAFQSQSSALTAISNPSTTYVLNGELHFIDSAGNLVKITNAGQVNVSTTGGITGTGYGTGGVEVNWDSVNGRYLFKTGSGGDQYADLVCSDVLLRDGSSNAIRLQSPSLVADYSVTLPSALPASQVIMQIDASGNVVASNSLASGANLTLVGTGRLKHGNFVQVVGGGSTYGVGVSVDATDGFGFIASTTSRMFYDCPALVGKRLVSVRLRVRDNATGTTTVGAELFTGSQAFTSTGASATSLGNGTDQTLTITPGSPIALTAGNRLVLRGTVSANNTGRIYWVEWTFDEV